MQPGRAEMVRPTAPINKMNHKWTDNEREFIVKNWNRMSDLDMAEALGMRLDQIRAQRYELGLLRTKRLKEEVVETHSQYFDVHALECWLTGTKKKAR